MRLYFKNVSLGPNKQDNPILKAFTTTTGALSLLAPFCSSNSSNSVVHMCIYILFSFNGVTRKKAYYLRPETQHLDEREIFVRRI
jgi:hypothetical protein